MWNMKALALTIQKLLARLKFQKGGQNDLMPDRTKTICPLIFDLRGIKSIINFIIINCFLIWRNLNHPHLLKDALCQDWLKLAQWFWRREFLNFVNVFSLFCNYLPLEKDGARHLNKLESPSPKVALWQVWLKLAQWFWRRFLNFVKVFSLFRNYLPLEKDRAIHLNQLESPSPKDVLCQIWSKLAQWF